MTSVEIMRGTDGREAVGCKRWGAGSGRSIALSTESLTSVDVEELLVKDRSYR